MVLVQVDLLHTLVLVVHLTLVLVVLRILDLEDLLLIWVLVVQDRGVLLILDPEDPLLTWVLEDQHILDPEVHHRTWEDHRMEHHLILGQVDHPLVLTWEFQWEACRGDLHLATQDQPDLLDQDLPEYDSREDREDHMVEDHQLTFRNYKIQLSLWRREA